MINVEIITIGDELLIGQVIDTNSAWMATELNKLGFDVQYKTTVGDNEVDIKDAFQRAFGRVSLVLVTGGIGPTKDDITRKVLCDFFQTKLIFDNQTLQTVEEVVKSIGKELNTLTKAQAYVPENAIIIQNRVGTAPVAWFERNGKILISMPGVPHEMKWIMSHEILPRIQKTFQTSDTIQHRTFLVANYSESLLAMKLEDFENALPDHIRLAYLPSFGLIRLRLTGKSENEEILFQELSGLQKKLKTILGKDLIGDTDIPIEEILAKKLIEKKLTLSFAESCTGGKLATLITAMSGASVYFKGSVVAYSNEAKIHILDVQPETIEKKGAVSQPVVEQMASGARKIFNSDCSIAVSGIAGPGGGTIDKPVGTVWISVSYKDQLKSELFHFTPNRESNISRSANAGIRMLLNLIQE